MASVDRPPEAMIAFVAEQVGVSPAAFADYALRDQTRREHAAELQSRLGMRRFGFADWRACLRVGADVAWATDRGEPIVQRNAGAVCAPRACSSQPRQSWSGSGLEHGFAPAGRRSRHWHPD